jgi:hypothetical protein
MEEPLEVYALAWTLAADLLLRPHTKAQ